MVAFTDSIVDGVIVSQGRTSLSEAPDDHERKLSCQTTAFSPMRSQETTNRHEPDASSVDADRNRHDPSHVVEDCRDSIDYSERRQHGINGRYEANNQGACSESDDDHDHSDDDLVLAMEQALEEGERQVAQNAIEARRSREELWQHPAKRRLYGDSTVLDVWGKRVALQSTPDEWQSVAIAGGVIGAVLGGPMVGFCAAVGGMTAAATDTGMVGEIARSGGEVVTHLLRVVPQKMHIRQDGTTDGQ